jgi:glycosyltransferase involved in cell wall biosynthesis
VRLLFAKHNLTWPRSSGHDVHTYYMMKACAALGHEVALATAVPPEPAAIDGLKLSAQYPLERSHDGRGTVPGSWLQKRYRSYYGIPDARVAALATAAKTSRADVAIIVGLDALPYFPALTGVRRVWYAADEWVWHHLSQAKLGDPELTANLREAAIKGVYERAHALAIDRVWVVSETERRAMRWLGGMRNVDILPNGVDGDFFAPGPEAPDEPTAVFWGRLDFGPNVQALEWFCREVWPGVRTRVANARFTIIGFQPTDAIRRLASTDGVSLMADVPDLRSTVHRHAVVALPFVSGGGIKNKLLEAAAMGKAIVCTPAAVHGIRTATAPVAMAVAPRDFAEALVRLWKDQKQRKQLGGEARAWAVGHHTWTATAREAIASLEASTLSC